jgi:Rad3-related DNA helicase
MQWDWKNRSLRLSVGELARFSLFSPSDERAGRWRMELGSHWHQVLRERAEAGQDGWTFEQTVTGTLYQNGWNFALQGRIDQFKPGPETAVLREVKTVTRDLPADEDELRDAYPHYFHQAMLYAFLVGREAGFPQTELLFLEIQTGLTQTVVLGERDLELLHEHLGSAVAELEERRGHFNLLRSLVIPPPFAEWRPGQQEARESLDAGLDSFQTLLFEAPTGFGKTGLAIEQALLRLASGEFDRILILTGKNTGHSPLLAQLEAFREAAPGLGVMALRSRKDHALDEAVESGVTADEIAERWMQSGLSAPAMLAEGIPDLERVRALGERHGIPPWAITRILLPYADVWIADFNYLFDPAVASVLEFTATHDPARTFLIIDEAHNLPERAAASRSHLLEADRVGNVLSEVQFARFPGALGRLLDHLLSLLKAQAPCDALEPADEADMVGLLREIEEAMRDSSFGDDELSDDSRDWLWNLPYLLADWDHPHLPVLASCPGKGRVLLSCIDAAPVIAPVLARFRRSLLMSATIQPWDTFHAAIGMDSSGTGCVVGESPWLEGCFEVMVDTRPDTRFRRRDHFLDTTAATIGQSALAGKGCTVAFFPSYAYANKVMERTGFQFPSLRTEIQPRDLPLEQQNAFLEQALLFDDLLFLVLGSRFSEGIDVLGGKISQAIVVSPALPEVNSLQKAKEERIPGGKAIAFRRVYQIPGMRKISQALGRLVRDPGQNARVLLHCKRFIEPDYLDLLPAYLQPVETIQTDEDLARKWLKS